MKRILIGDTHGFVDLVFYHRILKYHVLVELKVDEFRHEHLGRLNTYVTWYQRHMMSDGDQPPVGILLCARKDHVLVKYALAGLKPFNHPNSRLSNGAEVGIVLGRGAGEVIGIEIKKSETLTARNFRALKEFEGAG